MFDSWTDLNPEDADAQAGEGIFVASSTEQLVIQWNLPVFGSHPGAQSCNFEIVMRPANSVFLIYASLLSDSSSYPTHARPSIGLENRDGTSWLDIFYDDP